MNNKPLQQHKICFILCYNNELLLQECMHYLNQLYIPEGYQVDLLSITDASSMTAGYEEGREASDAKYKIYLHQDVFILNRNFLADMLSIFHGNENLGMLGMVGTTKLPKSAVMWETKKRIGALRSCTINTVDDFFDLSFSDFSDSANSTNYDTFHTVEAIDGLLIATQYDIPWNTSFTGWDFYDVSQSFAFRNAGYEVGVIKQQTPWVLHDCGFMNLSRYETARRQFLLQYEFPIDEANSDKRKMQAEKYQEKEVLLHETLTKFLENNDIQGLSSFVQKELKQYQNHQMMVLFFLLAKINAAETAAGEKSIFSSIQPLTLENAASFFLKIKLFLRRFEYDFPQELQEEAMQFFTDTSLSANAIYQMTELACIDQKKVYKALVWAFERRNNTDYATLFQSLC